MDTLEFIKRSKVIHGDRFDYSKVAYTNAHTKVEIICKKCGSFWQRPNGHLIGSGCKKCTVKHLFTKTKFVQQSQTIHKNYYSYPNIEWNGVNKKIEILCPVHGSFTQLPYYHLKGHGCKKCRNRYSDQKWLSIFNKKHGLKYDYTKSVFGATDKKIEIICPSHGPFSQSIISHSIGQGCPKCAHYNFCHGYRQSEWVSVQKGRTAKFYIIVCFSDCERFVKLGITFNDLKNRYSSGMPYDYTTIKIIESLDASVIWRLESRLKKRFKEFRYKPNTMFGGHTECYTIKNLTLIQDEADKMFGINN